MKLVGVNEASEMLGVKTSWLRTAVFKKVIPHYKLQRLIKFNLEELEKWVNNQRRDSTKEKK